LTCSAGRSVRADADAGTARRAGTARSATKATRDDHGSGVRERAVARDDEAAAATGATGTSTSTSTSTVGYAATCATSCTHNAGATSGAPRAHDACSCDFDLGSEKHDDSAAISTGAAISTKATSTSATASIGSLAAHPTVGALDAAQ
jgi:hypothetical protein